MLSSSVIAVPVMVAVSRVRIAPLSTVSVPPLILPLPLILLSPVTSLLLSALIADTAATLDRAASGDVDVVVVGDRRSGDGRGVQGQDRAALDRQRATADTAATIDPALTGDVAVVVGVDR